MRAYQKELISRALAQKGWTIQEVERYCREFGSHWFDADSKRFFRSRISDYVYSGPGGHFFVSSERFVSGALSAPRAYSVRQFKPENARENAQGSLIDDAPGTVFQQYKTSKAAHAAARRFAAGESK